MPYHQHKVQDEFIYVLEGTPVLVTDTGETQLSPGMCAGLSHLTEDGSSELIGPTGALSFPSDRDVRPGRSQDVERQLP